MVLCINTAHYTFCSVQDNEVCGELTREVWSLKCDTTILSVENETRSEIMLFVFENNPSAYLEGGLLNVKNSVNGMVGFSHQNSFAWN